ncbi:tpd52 like 2a isoform X13 [Pangasianodon hypophthalmus]|uniref:tpd52 like 2a isoform X13 n=1 Tax=Pangasianodon hypophthalmus TaxID=310915 RepID=UPI000EFDFA9F|nr:tpd52 like 2a isoform X13 [Pangasianodon hypophthalmus]
MQMDSGDRGSFTEGGASARTLPPGLTEQEAVELELELSKVEDEIQTLRHVLTAKERHAGELRRRLGISPLTELKSNLTKGWHEVQSSNAYKKTQETLSQAGMMTSSAFSSLGSAIRSRLGEMRNSPTFKNLEDKMAGKGSTNGEDA